MKKLRFKIEVVSSSYQFRRKGFWRLVGANGEILAHSEIYTTYSAAMKTARMVQEGLQSDSICTLKKIKKLGGSS